MELRQIKSFLSVAKTLNFSRTAEIIHLSQPALSLQIRALEDELGARLFDRNRRKTTLTAAGHVFHDEIAGIISQLDGAIHRTRLAADGKLGLIRIGFISTAGNEIVPKVVRSFRKTHPNVQFSLRNILTSDQLSMLSSNEIDVGLLRLPIERHPDLIVRTVHREPFVLVASSSHELAKRRKVYLRELSGEDFVMYERAYAPGFHDLLIGILGDAGVVPNITQTAGQMPTLISLVDAGMGIALLPASVVKHSAASVVACNILDETPMSEIAIVTRRKGSTAVVDTFISFVIDALAKVV